MKTVSLITENCSNWTCFCSFSINFKTCANSAKIQFFSSLEMICDVQHWNVSNSLSCYWICTLHFFPVFCSYGFRICVHIEAISRALKHENEIISPSTNLRRLISILLPNLCSALLLLLAGYEFAMQRKEEEKNRLNSFQTKE